MTEAEPGVGAWSPVMPVTLKVIQMCNKEKTQIEGPIKDKPNTNTYIPVVYCSQIVDGINYLVKVLLDASNGGVCVHVKILKPIRTGGTLRVTGIQFPKTFADPLIPFLKEQ